MSDFRRRLMMLRKSEGGLPSGYIKLNYLESTGTQYIDLCVTPSEIAKMQLIFDYQITDDFTKSSILFGAYDGRRLGFFQFFVFVNFDNIGFQFANINQNSYVTRNYSSTTEVVRQPSTVVLEVNERELGRVVVPAYNKENNRIGVVMK